MGTIVSTRSTLKNEGGVWVFRSGKKLFTTDTNKALRKVRRQRDRRHRGASQ